MIAVVAFAGLLPVFLIALFFLTKTREELTTNALENQKSLAEAVRQGISTQVYHYRKQLERFATDPEMQSLKTDRQSAALTRFLEQNHLFFSIFVYDASGTVTSLGYRNKFRGDDFLIGRNIFQAKDPIVQGVASSVRDVLQSRRLKVIERVQQGRRQPQLFVMAPIPSFSNPDRMIGVISAGIQIEGPQLQGTLEYFSVSKRSFLLLTDTQGYLLAKKGKHLPDGLMQMNLSHTLDEKEFESTLTDLAGTRYFLTVGRIPAISCFLAIGTPQDEILGFIHQILGGMMLLGLICLIIGVGVSLWLSNALLEPVMALIDGIKKVSDGIVSHRIPPEGENELSEACEAFNQMASQLEKNRLMEEIWSRTWNHPS
jgi:HAMP domain-containing protein